MPEVAWPGDELAAPERSVVRQLVEKGWAYLYCDGDDFAMQSPEQFGSKEWWRIDRDGKLPPRRERSAEPVPPPTPLAELYAKLGATLAKPALGYDPDDKTKAPGCTLKQVRSLVRQGFSGAQVTSMTGWGGYWFHDMLDTDGYYNEERERT